MKKFFAFFAAMLFAGSMMADSYVKVTEAPANWAGKYLIVYEGDASHAAVALKGALDAKENGVAVTITDGVIATADSLTSAEFTVAAVEGGYSLQAADGKYIGATSYANSLVISDTAIANSLESLVPAVVLEGGTVTMRYNYAKDQLRFRYYKSGQQAVALYKLTEGGVTPPADTYTVAGSMASIFGTTWDVANTDNDMKPSNGGLYKWEKAGLELAADTTIEFKVVKNHDWNNGANAYPASNYKLPVTEAAEYTLTITFDVATTAVAAQLTKKVPLADPTNCAEAAEAALSVEKNNDLYNDGKEYTIEGYVTSIAYAWKDGSMSFWMADTKEGGNVLEAYKCAIEKEEDAVRLGDKVAVTGKLTKYNTTPEFAQGCTVNILERAEVVEPKNLGEKTIAEFLELKNKVDTCVLTGVITNVVNTEYGNFYLADATDTLYVYGLKDAAGAYCFEAEGLAAGDTLTVKAVYNEYNKAPQAKNAVFVSVKKAPVEPGKDVALVLNNGMVSNEYIEDYGSTDIILFNIPVTEEGYIEGDGDYLDISIFPEDPNDISGTYTVANEGLDIEYTYLMQIAGTDTTEVDFVDGNVVVAIADADPETWSAKLTVAANLTAEDGTNYIVTFDMVVLYDFIEEEQGVENVAEDAKKVIKKIEAGNVVIEKNGVKYSVNGQVVR